MMTEATSALPRPGWVPVDFRLILSLSKDEANAQRLDQHSGAKASSFDKLRLRPTLAVYSAATPSIDVARRRLRHRPRERAARAFPPVGLADALAGLDLVQGHGVVEPAAQHHVLDLLGVADVLARVGVQHQQVGQLADLERAHVLGVAERVRRHDGAGAERIDRAPAA